MDQVAAQIGVAVAKLFNDMGAYSLAMDAYNQPLHTGYAAMIVGAFVIAGIIGGIAKAAKKPE